MKFTPVPEINCRSVVRIYQIVPHSLSHLLLHTAHKVRTEDSAKAYKSAKHVKAQNIQIFFFTINTRDWQLRSETDRLLQQSVKIISRQRQLL